MFSTVVNDAENYPIKIFDADVLEYGNETFYVTQNPDYLDYPEGSQYTISTIDNGKIYDIAIIEGQSFEIIGNVFEGDYKLRLRHYLRDYKRRIINSIGIPNLEWVEKNDPLNVKIEKRKANNQKIDKFRVDAIPELFLEGLDKSGFLNAGLCCPFCGLTPLTKRVNWPYQKKWSNGIFLNVCKDCFEIVSNK